MTTSTFTVYAYKSNAVSRITASHLVTSNYSTGITGCNLLGNTPLRMVSVFLGIVIGLPGPLQIPAALTSQHTALLSVFQTSVRHVSLTIPVSVNSSMSTLSIQPPQFPTAGAVAQASNNVIKPPRSLLPPAAFLRFLSISRRDGNSSMCSLQQSNSNTKTNLLFTL